MAKKKVKGKVSRKTVEGKHVCDCGKNSWISLSSIAFILFLITVWPGLNNLVNSIHWGWFLLATIILVIVGWKSFCRCKVC